MKLIVLRGNSGVGKTTTAKALLAALGPSTLLLSQDTIRRVILNASDHVGTPAIQLIKDLIVWGQTQSFEAIILEGILKKTVYGPMLAELRQQWGAQMLTVYFELPFEVAFKRNQTKPNAFDQATLASWWQTDDLLGDEALCFGPEVTLDTQVRLITEKCQVASGDKR